MRAQLVLEMFHQVLITCPEGLSAANEEEEEKAVRVDHPRALERCTPQWHICLKSPIDTTYGGYEQGKPLDIVSSGRLILYHKVRPSARGKRCYLENLTLKFRDPPSPEGGSHWDAPLPLTPSVHKPMAVLRLPAASRGLQQPRVCNSRRPRPAIWQQTSHTRWATLAPGFG